jgi:hypothetical protein
VATNIYNTKQVLKNISEIDLIILFGRTTNMEFIFKKKYEI